MKRLWRAWVWLGMRFAFFSFFFSLVLGLGSASGASPFEGRIDYAVNSGGMEMSYSFWVKGNLWRSELRSGSQLFELRLGNLESGEAYLVNSGGESYRALGRSGGRGPGGGPPSGGRSWKEEKKEPNLEKLLSVSGETTALLDRDAVAEVLKGPGKKLRFWWNEDLGLFPVEALPRLKGFEGKEQVLSFYFRERAGGVPLKIEIPKASGKNAFSMEAVSLEEMALVDSFLSLPDGYKMEVGGRPMGGGGGGGRRPGGGGGGRQGPPM
ncbi:hypothetical protein [Pelagicoccus sp. SDUM812005]|uniref:hypothetical protein n=1 Tax=Pelagicoccus sp. SDUM812005 TaxID=3041257 RepID=UPI00280EA474|nr:hypothetical protein [Pelagicoccus sp. SDUM812005]MDQ8181214.1 hypothetical protein [Pelagicoccus sp. SDUM812005]